MPGAPKCKARTPDFRRPRFLLMNGIGLIPLRGGALRSGSLIFGIGYEIKLVLVIVLFLQNCTAGQGDLLGLSVDVSDLHLDDIALS